MDKKALQAMSYGMYLLTTVSEEGKKYGCILNTATQVTSEPVKICFHLNKENETTKQLLQSKNFALSVLSTKVHPNVISIFGFQSSKDVDKFQEIAFEMVDGLPVIQEKMSAWMIGNILETVDMGSHISFFAEIKKGERQTDFDAMTYDYYHRVIQGKAPKKAPTYVEEPVEENTYVCDVCGYRVQGEISDDFVCPICGMPRSHFKKQN